MTTLPTLAPIAGYIVSANKHTGAQFYTGIARDYSITDERDRLVGGITTIWPSIAIAGSWVVAVQPARDGVKFGAINPRARQLFPSLELALAGAETMRADQRARYAKKYGAK